MINFFMSGGYVMWILLILFVLIIFLSFKKLLELFGKKELARTKLEDGINAILFWGSICVVLGFFAHFLGIYMAMNAIAQANDISPAIVAMGYGMSLTSILFGLFIFIISTSIWFFLRWRLKKIVKEGN
jgi:biopolymer transport protein ExbB/TolQ